jgi:arylsulfatase A-like enzyme
MFCKHTNYEQATRSPLIIAAPGTCPEGLATTAPTEFVDIYPTLCDLAKIPLRPELEGTSLVPLMADPKASVKDVAISQYNRRYDQQDVMGYAYRNRRYRYVEWQQIKFREGERNGPVVLQELYDYETDPLERRNLAEDPAYAEQLKRMMALARAARKEMQA